MRVVLTGLETGLLDRQSGSYGAARQALAALERRSIPLILISSYPRAQVDPVRLALELEHPFITEGGMALYVPEHYFPQSVLDPSWRHCSPYYVQEFGVGSEHVRQMLKPLRMMLQSDLVGYGDWTAVELALWLGCSVEMAQTARQREYSEIFSYTGDPMLLQQAAAGLVTEGGSPLRIRPIETSAPQSQWILSASHHPDPLQEATRILLQCYQDHLGVVETSLGIGSEPQDSSFLVLTKTAVALPSPQVQSLWAQARDNWQLADLPGPEGWNDVVLTWLEETDGDE
jgi:mannosyl-3-phosphoglycerate phosphatase